MATIWVTPPNLGSVPENQYYNLNLETYDTSGSVTYALIAGSLPGNLTIASNGNISGNTAFVNNYVTSNFTVRATNADSGVTDRTFTLSVISPVPPNLTPNSGSLTTVIDGQYYSQQFSLDDPSVLANTIFFVDSGTIPAGLTFASNGLMYGYANAISANATYTFTVQANDGGKIDQNTYTLDVISRKTLTADSDYYTADNVSIITSDTSTQYTPILLDSGNIGNITQGDNFSYRLQAVDFDNANLTYQLASGSLPSGLNLNANTGWITGTIPTGALITVTNSFSANVYKTASPTFVSNTNAYTLTVDGEVDNRVIWSTDTNIGSIYNGEISEFAITASTPSGRQLLYTVLTNVISDPITFESNRALDYGLISYGALPPGLTLLRDGSLSGRPSFEMSSNLQTYVFTISASDADGLVTGQKEFSIDVVQRDKRPYENLYISVMPDRTGRTIYSDLINNTDIIPKDYLYRAEDPWFGTNTLRRVLFMSGLNPDEIADYISAITLNHYNKKLNFGNLKTARAVDDNFNTVYEVIYLDLVDEQVNQTTGIGPNVNVSWPTNNAGITTVHPNSFPNMISRVADNVGYQDRSILPLWMTSRQSDGTVLGFTRALVLCYTLPNYSAEIAYRITTAAPNFNLIDFTIDRYDYDSILSDNFIKTPVTGTGNITANTQSNSIIGNSTIFSNELQVGSTIFVNNTAIGNVANITSNTAITLYANASANVANLSYTYSNSFVVVNYTLGTGNITANTSSNVVTGNSANITGTGTISGNTGNATIIGSGTAFSTELKVGTNLYVSGNTIGVIKSIISSTNLALEVPLTSNISSSAYTAQGTSTLFTTELYVGDVLIDSGNVVIGTVSTITNNTSLILTTNAAANVSNDTYSHTTRDPYTTPGQGDKYLKFPQFGVI